MRPGKGSSGAGHEEEEGAPLWVQTPKRLREAPALPAAPKAEKSSLPLHQSFLFTRKRREHCFICLADPAEVITMPTCPSAVLVAALPCHKARAHRYLQGSGLLPSFPHQQAPHRASRTLRVVRCLWFPQGDQRNEAARTLPGCVAEFKQRQWKGRQTDQKYSNTSTHPWISALVCQEYKHFGLITSTETMSFQIRTGHHT